MKHGRVAQRYAEALLQAAVDAKVEQEVADDIAALKTTIEGSHDLQLLLKSPVIKKDRKRTALKAIFGGKMNATTLGFLDLVTEKGREDALSFIIDRFIALRNERLGIIEVAVTSGIELTGDQQKALQDRFAHLTQKTVRMDTRVDASLKGGFLARVGDTVFDGSIKRQLEIIRRRFLEGDGTN